MFDSRTKMKIAEASAKVKFYNSSGHVLSYVVADSYEHFHSCVEHSQLVTYYYSKFASVCVCVCALNRFIRNVSQFYSLTMNCACAITKQVVLSKMNAPSLVYAQTSKKNVVEVHSFLNLTISTYEYTCSYRQSQTFLKVNI